MVVRVHWVSIVVMYTNSSNQGGGIRKRERGLEGNGNQIRIVIRLEKSDRKNLNNKTRKYINYYKYSSQRTKRLG